MSGKESQVKSVLDCFSFNELVFFAVSLATGRGGANFDAQDNPPFTQDDLWKELVSRCVESDGRTGQAHNDAKTKSVAVINDWMARQKARFEREQKEKREDINSLLRRFMYQVYMAGTKDPHHQSGNCISIQIMPLEAQVTFDNILKKVAK